jgi:hypothetical protein
VSNFNALHNTFGQFVRCAFATTARTNQGGDECVSRIDLIKILLVCCDFMADTS